MSNSGPTVEIAGNIAIASAPPRISELARELEPGDRVGRERGEHDRDRGRDQGDHDRVDQRSQQRAVEAALEQRLVVVEADVGRDQAPVGDRRRVLERQREQPEDREEGGGDDHEHADRSRTRIRGFRRFISPPSPFRESSCRSRARRRTRSAGPCKKISTETAEPSPRLSRRDQLVVADDRDRFGVLPDPRS